MSGFLIVSLIPGSPAILAGVKPNDRLIAIDDKLINSIDDFVSAHC
jgi:S1-C subfamily serine protease